MCARDEGNVPGIGPEPFEIRGIAHGHGRNSCRDGLLKGIECALVFAELFVDDCGIQHEIWTIRGRGHRPPEGVEGRIALAEHGVIERHADVRICVELIHAESFLGNRDRLAIGRGSFPSATRCPVIGVAQIAPYDEVFVVQRGGLLVCTCSVGVAVQGKIRRTEIGCCVGSLADLKRTLEQRNGFGVTCLLQRASPRLL